MTKPKLLLIYFLGCQIQIWCLQWLKITHTKTITTTKIGLHWLRLQRHQAAPFTSITSWIQMWYITTILKPLQTLIDPLSPFQTLLDPFSPSTPPHFTTIYHKPKARRGQQQVGRRQPHRQCNLQPHQPLPHQSKVFLKLPHTIPQYLPHLWMAIQ